MTDEQHSVLLFLVERTGLPTELVARALCADQLFCDRARCQPELLDFGVHALFLMRAVHGITPEMACSLLIAFAESDVQRGLAEHGAVLFQQASACDWLASSASCAN